MGYLEKASELLPGGYEDLAYLVLDHMGEARGEKIMDELCADLAQEHGVDFEWELEIEDIIDVFGMTHEDLVYLMLSYLSEAAADYIVEDIYSEVRR